MVRPPELTLVTYMGMAPVQKVVKTRLFGGPYLSFADLVIVSAYQYQTGAILARAKLDKLTTLAQMVSPPGRESEAIGWLQDLAKDRLDEYVGAFGGQPDSLLTFVFYTEYKRVGILIPSVSMENINTRTKQVKKVAFTKMALKDVEPQIRNSMLEGIGFGSSFPALTEKMYRTNEEIDMERWSEMRGHGLDIPETPEIITLEEQEEIVLSMVATYAQKYFPQLVGPLGLAEVLSQSEEGN